MLRLIETCLLLVCVRAAGREPDGARTLCSDGLGCEPGGAVVLLFVGVELGRVTQREADVVQTLDEAVLAEGIDLEGGVEAMNVRDSLLFERDG